MHRGRLNLLFLAIGVLLGFWLYQSPEFHKFIENLGRFGYLGAFLAGMAYDSTVTVVPSLAVLAVLAQELSPLEVALVAGIGAALGDYLIFRFVHDDLVRDLKPIVGQVFSGVERIGFFHKRLISLKHLSHTRYFHWTMPIIAAFLIGSPFPNELAVGLMGTTQIRPRQFVLIDFMVNFIGILLIVSAADLIRP